MSEAAVPSRRRAYAVRAARGSAVAVAGTVAAIVAMLLILDSAIGHRFVADRIADLAPRSGLRVEVGRIDGSLFGETVLHDLVFRDPEGVFLTVPRAELDWRPLSWLRSGLDIRELTLHRGYLRRLPALRPGDPDSPALPGFDIRVDRLVLDRFTVAEGVVGPARRVDLTAKADIRAGRLLLDVDGKLGGKDRLQALIDAQPDRDKFDVRLDYAAPAGGLLAGLFGAEDTVRARIVGKGAWTLWDGAALIEQNGRRIGAFKLSNRRGVIGILGLADARQLVPTQYARALGPSLAIRGEGSLKDRALSGKLWSEAAAFRLNAGGRVDLSRNLFDEVVLKLALTKPELLIAQPRIAGATLDATLNGPFRNVAIAHWFKADAVQSGTLAAFGIANTGTARLSNGRLRLPLALTARRVVTGNPQLDPRLVDVRVAGMLDIAKGQLRSDSLRIAARGLSADLALRGDTAAGTYGIAGPIQASGFRLANLGVVSGNAKLVARLSTAGPWRLRANLAGRMDRVENATLANLSGGNLRFAGAVDLAAGQAVRFDRFRLTANKLNLQVSGRYAVGGTTTVVGSGRHVDYGPFTVDAAVGRDGPQAVLVFASPFPAAKLANVRVALSPIRNGFRIETSGGSMLGPFDGTLGLYATGRETRIAIERLAVSDTQVTGTVLLAGGGLSGDLALNGGGVTGTVKLARIAAGQQVSAQLNARDARFGGEQALTIARGDLTAVGVLAPGRTTIDGSLTGQGVIYGGMALRTVAARAALVNGSGTVSAAVSGRSRHRFNLVGSAAIRPDWVSALVKGDYGGRAVSMPRRAVLTRIPPRAGGGWQIAPAQVNLGAGRLVVSGKALGRETDLRLGMVDMPLSAADLFLGEAGLGGTASGVVQYRAVPTAPATGTARLRIKGLTRSGLVLSSRPLDVSLVARLEATQLALRAVLADQAQTSGRLQARIANLPRDGTLMARLRQGALFGQLRYGGPADALWRLTGIEAFDLTGMLSVAADASGTLDNPNVRGSLSSQALRLQSTLTGTDVSQITTRGTFSGSRLVIASFAGRAANGGRLAGSGSIDLSGLATGGIGMDLKIAARDALVIDREDMAAAVTGPIRIVSGSGRGTIAGRLSIDTARWQLGRAVSAAQLPVIRTVHRNLPADAAVARASGTEWRYLIDAAGDNRIDVRGLGIDSEWGAAIRLRGTVANPQIFGNAELVRGGYEFAGKRFELSRGNIAFAGEAPPDPRLDIAAEADVQGIAARITVRGTAQRPEIAFTSIPALPEEEVLSRLLFGSSITNISAPEALQLGAALASLRGGGGLDPINKLRSAIGLDRLRIVSADAAEGRSTSVSVGKYIGRRLFVEIVTDGRGYSATQLEFRITRWLSLLGSVSSLGQESINARASKDY